MLVVLIFIGCGGFVTFFHFVLKTARSDKMVPPLAMLVSRTDTAVCPKCVKINKSGKRSCCARGGAWFKTCGDVIDTQFRHTWAEGIQACKSRL